MVRVVCRLAMLTVRAVSTLSIVVKIRHQLSFDVIEGLIERLYELFEILFV
jgi:hypothetical protein